MGKGRTQQCWQQGLDRRNKITCLGFCKGEAGRVYQEVEAKQSRQRWMLGQCWGCDSKPRVSQVWDGSALGRCRQCPVVLICARKADACRVRTNSCGFQMLIYSILARWSRWKLWLPWAPFLGSGCKPFKPLWRMVWVCLLKEWNPGISCSFPLSLSRFCGMLSTLEHMPSAGATSGNSPPALHWQSCMPRVVQQG